MNSTSTGIETPQKTAPLIKWPGGKRALIPSLMPHIPKNHHRYFEPFFGGGALFFALRPDNSILSDTNADLINCYEQVRSAPSDIIRILRKLKNTAETYYQIRDWRPSSDLERAARFLYLTRLSFNGIHRVNLRGEFNVPYGHKTHLSSLDEDLIIAASDALKGAKLLVSDFEASTSDAGSGDLVYFDPPYTVAHSHNGFVKYNENIFSWNDQVRLARHAEVLAKKGCHVIVSNADHFSVEELYPTAELYVVERHSVIAASANHRRRVSELIFVLKEEV